MADFIIRGGNIAMPVKVKLAQRFVLTLPRLRGRDGERETGHTWAGVFSRVLASYASG